MRVATLAVALFVPVVALAQQPNPPSIPANRPPMAGNQRADSANSEKGRIEGHVSNQAGEPLRRATVTAMRGPSQGEVMTAASLTRLTGETDAQGNFVFEDLDSGRYSINVQRSGYVNGSQMVAVAGGTAKVELILAQGGLIAGKVLDEVGEPFRRARVTVYRKRYINSQWTLMQAQGGAADDDGAFAIGGLAPAKYYVSAEDSQAAVLSNALNGVRQASSPQPSEAYVTTYYPGVTDLPSASGFELSAGAEVRGIEIRLKKMPAFRVRGKAVFSSGSIPESLSILYLTPLGESTGAAALSRNPARLRPDGGFEFSRVAPGRYALSYTRSSTTGLVGRANVTVTDRDVENVLLEVGTGADISGTFHLPAANTTRAQAGAPQQPQQGQPPQASQLPPNAQQRRNPSILISSVDAVPTGSAQARAEENGSFVLKGVGPGTYRVAVSGLPAGMYVKSVRYAGQTSTGMVIDVASGSAGALDINVDADAADVSGTVRDSNGSAIPRAVVVLWHPGDTPSAAPRYAATSQSDQSGSFRLQNAPPGDYMILAWEQIEGVDSAMLGAPELLNAFSSSATSVTLDPNGHFTVTLKTIPKEAAEKEAAKIR